MANNTISQVEINGTTYDLLDANTLDRLSDLETTVTTLESSMDNIHLDTYVSDMNSLGVGNQELYLGRYNDSTANKPTNSWGIFLHYGHGQIAWGGTDQKVYSRGYFASSWSEWITWPNYNMSFTSGTGTLNSTYCSSGAISYWKQNCQKSAIVTVHFDVNLKGTYSSDNVCIFGSGLPVPRGAVQCAASGISTGSHPWVLVASNGKIQPWFCGNVSGHWYGTVTYLADI